MAEVKLLGADRLIARLIRMEKAINPAAVKSIRRVAEEIRDTAKNLCPVDTGSLKKSIRVGSYARPAKHVFSIRVTAGGHITNPKSKRKVDYASYVEFGTSRNKPQPFLGPAIKKYKEALAKAIKDEIKE